MLLTKEKPNIEELRLKGTTFLFLPSTMDRKGEGGLRTRGYFKYSYRFITQGKELENQTFSKHSNGIWCICGDLNEKEINLKPAPENIQEEINCFLRTQNIVEGKDIFELPLITVVTVVLNGKKFLESTIQSVINQTYPNIEYIIIDGGSTDGTLEIIKKYEDKIDYWISERDKGPFDAMNKGIDLTTGYWINFMNAGDRFYKRETIKSIFLMNSQLSKYEVIYGDLVYSYIEFEKFIKSTNNISQIWKGMLFSHQSTFIKSSYHKTEKYNTEFKIAADYYFFYKSYLEGKKFFYFSQPIAIMLMGGISSHREKTVREYMKILKKLDESFENSLKKKIYYKLYIFYCLLTLFLKRFLPKKIILYLLKLK